ncbi:MAG: GspE/PulE family protein [Lentisphaerae bacterium]|nr:GspE/PulE family protein [Lentisphaerota bacterium]MBT5608280.1 GspE/PulE family protein [Lentisphaerota bacterium]MBT7061820.1 GspE/PulE family protein [Lentisphaerota bacterium]MBT7846129.1 GspE/PulE family protein [Lentisphaerota bacterium]
MEQQGQLTSIYERIQQADRLEDIIWDVAPDILEVLQTERMTIYERSPDGSEIVSRFKTGDDIGVIRLPLSPSSIAGYVAMSQQAVRVDDVYDAQQLTSIHSRLHFDYSYDQVGGFLTRSMMVVPMCFGDTLLGVLQVMNRIGEGVFTESDLLLAQEICRILAQKIRYDRESTEGPYEYLIAQGRITRQQLEEIEQAANDGVGSVPYLLKATFELTTEEIGASLEQYYQVPFMGYNEEVVPPESLVESLNKSFLIRNTWVPVSGDRERAVILIDNPNDAQKIMDIQGILNADSYEFMVGLEEDILRYLGVAPDEKEEEQEIEVDAPEVGLEDLVGRLDDERNAKGGGKGGDKHPDELIDENAATVVQLVNKMIADAVELGASDVHIEPSKGDAPAVVRMRVDGVCRPVLQIPSSHIRYVVARIKIMSKVDIAESRLPQDGKIACRLYGSPLELRVATLPTVNGESVIMRILAAGAALPFDKLNLMPRNEEKVQKMLDHPHGLMLVVGPTGSGKTTTLHAILGVINKPERKILTAEDPVEITQPGLQQIQIQSAIGFDFARALRAFLRADPDVILIGEMRDYETAHSGIEASLTGHLVFSTLHTNSAPETITRLLDMGLDPLNFSDAFVGVVAQRLIRTLCSQCKEPYTPSSEDFEKLVSNYGPEYFPELGVNEADLELYRAVGCERCGGTGYKGRTGVHEVLMGTQTVKEMILSKPGAGELRELAMMEGMRSLMQDGIAKVFKGQCDFQQVRAVTLS